jgi:hypothetical protein
MWKLSLFCAVILLGIALRIFYYVSSGEGWWSHDYPAHIEYLVYVLKHWAIPPTQGGFVYYHPPLYYFLLAAFSRITEMMGAPPLTGSATAVPVSAYVLMLSPVFSILTLFFAALIGIRLFRFRTEFWWRLAFVYYMAVFPGLIFMGAKCINNDMLLLLFSYIFFWQLACFWQTGKSANWRATFLTAAAACLSKGNGVLLIVAAFGSLLLKKSCTMRDKARKMMSATIWLLIICGWYGLWRIVFDKQSELCGNAVRYLEPHSLYWTPFQFNPLSVVLNPFVIAWQRFSAYEVFPERFWETLFKSYFFGEFNFTFHSMASLTELLAMVLLLYGLYGIYLEVRKRQIFYPCLIVLISQLGAVWLYRLRLGYFSGLGDFRYVPITLVPIFYYTINGIRATSGFLRYTGIFFLVALGICCFKDIFEVVYCRF